MALRLKIFYVLHPLPIPGNIVVEKEVNDWLLANNITSTNIETFYVITKFKSIDDAFNPFGIVHIIYILYK